MYDRRVWNHLSRLGCGRLSSSSSSDVFEWLVFKETIKKHLFLLMAYKNNLFNENHLSMPMNHLR